MEILFQNAFLKIYFMHSSENFVLKILFQKSYSGNSRKLVPKFFENLRVHEEIIRMSLNLEIIKRNDEVV